MKKLLVITTLALASLGAIAQTASTEMAQAEVRKVDLDAKKITLKHGPIKNLDMPPMTMVFIVHEKSLINGVVAGDQVRFKVISDGGKMVITELIK